MSLPNPTPKDAPAIRDAAPDDIPALVGYIVMAEGEMAHFFAGGDDPDLIADELAKFVRSPAPCRYGLEFARVADIGGHAVGAAFSFPADRQPELDRPILEALRRRGRVMDGLFFEGEPGSWYLSTMAVDPAFRGRGVGRALMADAEERARLSGHAQCSLLVARDKDRARSMYERRGYAIRASVAIGGFDYFRMVVTPGRANA